MELRSKRGADITTLPYEEVGSTLADAPRKVLRNTYMLLGLNLAFSALIAGTSAAMAWPAPGILLTLAGFFGLLFAISRFRDSGVGVLLTFALTGFMGYTIGPLLSSVVALPGGGQIVTMALGATAGVFLAMSTWASVTKRDLSGMGGFLFIGMVVAILAGLGAIFFQMPALSLTVSAAVVLLMAGMIAFETQRIVRGGETNYVMATTGLFVSIFNLFTSLLQLFGFMSSSD
ncbi:inhibitor of apoptosis-promoting Bax1 family protein [Methyloversatilis sp. RAC08]|uniref:Bax inhibitor-1/YccA family protein n=1 Tax=Methyloversatilis sp. RAC08 TaxID=1842540 RepID=UPI00083DC981|nr:Bax inhibitor-1/YccA family protein [Methyloversatilis sp. RAC08]AOF82486.1 inhibitor of apoptosis-promoting Bax1 family protein [Methyloversatilis sp. RAC08]